MQLGNLNRRIVIERPTFTADVNGQEVISWTADSPVAAMLSFDSAGESVEADQRVARRVVKFTIRYQDVDETCRILHDSKYYAITGIERLHRKRYLVIKCFYADR